MGIIANIKYKMIFRIINHFGVKYIFQIERDNVQVFKSSINSADRIHGYYNIFK